MDTLGCISARHVRDVLRDLSRDRAPARTPLAGLELVRRSLEEAGFQPTPQACRYEVGRILADLVDTELRRLRRLAGVVQPGPSDGTDDQIRADCVPGHHDLEAWSAIYFLYLRPDLSLGLRDLEEVLADRHRRTIQRRLRQGVEALALRVRHLEREAVLANRRERLLSRLPPAAGRRLVGVDALVQQVTALLADGDRRHVVALGGPGGVGKTAIAREVARRRVAAGAVDELIWLPGLSATLGLSSSLDGLLREIGWTQNGEVLDTGRVHSMLTRQRCLLIVDGLDDPLRATAVAQAAAALPERSGAILTGRVGWSGVPALRVVNVPALAPESALELLRREADDRGLGDAVTEGAEDLAAVIRATGGNPLAILVSVGQLRFSDSTTVCAHFSEARGVAATLYHNLWASAWRRCSAQARAVAAAVVHLESSGRTVDLPTVQACGALLEDATQEALREAVDAGLVVLSGPSGQRRYRAAMFLADYLRCGC